MIEILKISKDSILKTSVQELNDVETSINKSLNEIQSNSNEQAIIILSIPMQEVLLNDTQDVLVDLHKRLDQYNIALFCIPENVQITVYEKDR